MKPFAERLQIQINHSLEINSKSKKEINAIIKTNLQDLKEIINKLEPIEELDIRFYNSTWTEKIEPNSELGIALAKTINLFNLYIVKLYLDINVIDNSL